MRDDACIEIRDLGVRFRLFHERVTTLKEAVVHRFRQYQKWDDFWALKGVSVSVRRGETVGIIGHNGSGKSTLLKTVAGVLDPTEGTVDAQGRIAPLIELGAGFDPELTGRDNVFLNGAILGFGRKEMQAKFDRIVDWAELSEFIDLPVKNYSSGMYMRLGFAIATDVEPDILIIDEILAVGDEHFQQKCMERVRQFQKAGVSILFVSHALEQMQTLCDRLVLLDHGHLAAEGKPVDVVKRYREIIGAVPAPAA